MRRKRPLSTGTKLLTATENEKFKAVLGQDRVSLCAAIVQLLRTSREDPWSWQKAHTGVVSLVKDYSRRSFVIAVFDVEYFDLLWEQMLYENFQAKGYPNCPCLITFEGDNFMYGLNFADLEEARNFKQYLDKRYETEQKHHVAALQHESRGDIQPANLISADVRQAHVIRGGEPETGTETMIARKAPDHEYAEVAQSSYAEVAPDASLARILSGSKVIQQASYANSYRLESIGPSDALTSAENRIFEQTYPWDSNYSQGSLLGQGAFGKVFEAWLREDEGRLHKVAIKHVETRSKEAFDRHMQEARLMLQFRHPYLLGCYEVYTYNNGCTYNVFVVMDCMSYGSLDVILTEMQGNHAFFSERSARYILFCCTQALAFLHSRNIIHRDVKSANILVSSEGRAKLGDFGLSGRLDQGAGTSIVGTPSYMAPEIARKYVGHNSEAYTKEVDIFSLGIVGIELACGQLPHREGTAAEVCAALCDEEFSHWLLHKMDESLMSREAHWSNNYSHFVEKCLTFEASQRMKALELLTLELFASVYS